jgi:hypothetical protein
VENSLGLVDGLDPLLLALVGLGVSLGVADHVLNLVLKRRDKNIISVL